MLMDYFIKHNTTFAVNAFDASSAELLLCYKKFDLEKVDTKFTTISGIPCDDDESVKVIMNFPNRSPLSCEIGIVAVTGGRLSTGKGQFERRNKYSADHECAKFQAID